MELDQLENKIHLTKKTLQFEMVFNSHISHSNLRTTENQNFCISSIDSIGKAAKHSRFIIKI